MSKLTREEFRALRTRAEHDLAQSREVPSILICAGTGCIAGGAMKIYDNFKSECEARGLKVYVGLKHDSDEEKSLHHRPEKVRLPRLLRDGPARAHRANGCDVHSRQA